MELIKKLIVLFSEHDDHGNLILDFLLDVAKIFGLKSSSLLSTSAIFGFVNILFNMLRIKRKTAIKATTLKNKIIVNIIWHKQIRNLTI